MANSADKTMDNYFSAVGRGTQQTNDLSDVQKQLQEATYIAVDSTVDMAEVYENLKKNIGDYGAALEVAGEQAMDSQDRLHKKIEEELNERQKVIDYYSAIPDKLKEQIDTKDDLINQEQEQQEQEQDDYKEHRKKKQGLLKRIRSNLEANAKEGGGFTKTYGSRAILAATDGIKSLFSGLVQQIPLFNEVKAGFSKGKSIVQDINQTRIRRKEAKDEKVKDKFKKKGESELSKREKKRAKKMRKKDLKMQKKMLKGQTEGNKLLEKMNRRMMFQSLFNIFGNLMNSLTSIITSAVSMAFKGLGLVSAIGGLARLLSGLGGKNGLLTRLARTMGINIGGGDDKDKKNKKKPKPKQQPKQQPKQKKIESKNKTRSNKIMDKAKNIGKTAGNIAKSGGSKMARTGLGAAKFAGKMALRAVPGLGWGLLAYDAINLATGGAADEMVGKAVDKAGEAISSAVDSIGSWFGGDEEKAKEKPEQPATPQENKKRKQVLEKKLSEYVSKFDEAADSGDATSAAEYAKQINKYRRELKSLDEQPSGSLAERDVSFDTTKLKPTDKDRHGRMLEHHTNKYEQARADGEMNKARMYRRAMEHHSKALNGDTNVTNVSNSKNYKQYPNDNTFISGNRYARVER